MSDDRSSSWIKSNLAAIGSAAVLSVYATGYVRTKPAADRLEEESDRAPARRRAALQATGPAIDSAPASRETKAETSPQAAQPAQIVATAAPKTTVADTTVPSAPAPTVAPTSAPQEPRATTTAAPPAPAPPASTTSTDSTPTPAPTPDAPVVPGAPRKLATDAVATVPASQPSTAAKATAGYKDGLFSGWGTSRHGDIQAYVEIKGGKIVSAFISECLTQYSCSWIAKLPAQVVERQGSEIDYVSGATQSSNALYYAVVDALKKAK